MAESKLPASAAAGDTWDIKRMLEWCEGYLAHHGDASPRRSAQWLVCEATGLSRIELYMDMNRLLEPAELDFLRSGVKRRGAGEPLQYITGSAPFRFITVKVEPGVLIPRPETEALVSALLDMLPSAPRRIAVDSHTEDEIAALLESQTDGSRNDGEDAGIGACDAADGADVAIPPIDIAEDSDAPIRVLEIGTGSGCIACALASERSDVRVTATDISPTAVGLARRNARDLGVCDRVSVIECDLGAGVASEALGTFDALISNPPYIPTSVYEGLACEVHDYEPRLALDGGVDGLDFLRRLLPFARTALRAGGTLAVELHEDRLEQAARLAQEEGFVDVAVLRDLADRPRILTARMPVASR